MGAEALRGVAAPLDMWGPTSNQAAHASKIHYDALYVPQDDGVVSREVANLLINAGCNPRTVPARELQ